jgi:hypothetical protein
VSTVAVGWFLEKQSLHVQRVSFNLRAARGVSGPNGIKFILRAAVRVFSLFFYFSFIFVAR